MAFVFDDMFFDILRGVNSPEPRFAVKRILFRDPATVVFWGDGTKTVAKVGPNDEYSPYYGFVAALAKKVYGSSAKVNSIIEPWLPEEPEPQKKPPLCMMRDRLFCDCNKDKEEPAKKCMQASNWIEELAAGDTDGDTNVDTKEADKAIDELATAIADAYMDSVFGKDLMDIVRAWERSKNEKPVQRSED